VAARKHKHLLKMARALRLQAALPIELWGHYILTATHLINKLPTTVLGYLTPYEVLLGHKPYYSMLGVFGCLAFAANPERVKDKMGIKGVLCVFLGYPQSQKGYKLLNLLTKLVFVSRDVTFVEHVFPYNPTSDTYCMRPIPSVTSSSSPICEDYVLPVSSAPPPLNNVTPPVISQPDSVDHHDIPAQSSLAS